MFVVVVWLSACNVYHGNSLKSERQSEQPVSTAPGPHDRNFELIGFRPPSTLELKIEPATGGTASPPPMAGTHAPSKNPPRQDEGQDEEDAGVKLVSVDAGKPEIDAGKPQKIETGRPHEDSEIDAGKPHPHARVSAACRGEAGFQTDGRCYFVLDAPVSWNVGRDHCYEHNAHLASVTSEHESDLIASFALEQDVWIGFSRFGAANFSWLTNESTSFSNWKKGAPRAMQESGALITARTGLWTNAAVSELHPALCETER